MPLLKVIHLWVIFFHCVFQTVGYGPLLVGIEISLMGLFFLLKKGGCPALYKKKKLFIFGRAGPLRLCGLSLVVESRELLSSCSERASHYSGFSCCKAWALGHVGFSSCRTQAQ